MGFSAIFYCDMLLEDMLRKEKDKGIAEDRRQLNALTLALSQNGRIDDIIRAASDPEYQEQLLKQFGLQQ